MLSYAYRTVNLSEFKNFDTESFDNVKHLYAEILTVMLPSIIRGGLVKEYINTHEQSNVIRGKIDINESIKTSSIVHKKLVVQYDEFSEDVLLNQIVKSTLIYLIHSSDLDKSYKKGFHSFLPYFGNVKNIELNLDLWRKVTYHRQSLRYHFIIDICRFLFEELLHSEGHTSKQRSIVDEQQLPSLYENFVYNFYEIETGFKVSCPIIKWKVDDGFSEALPNMKTDIVLQSNNQTLIIDTKFYSANMSNRYGEENAKQLSSNLYQVFSYVNNWDIRVNERVGAMLLYARTQSKMQPNHQYKINGNEISVVGLDLNMEFELIKRQLLFFARDFFESAHGISD